jgi:hypothetical protein
MMLSECTEHAASEYSFTTVRQVRESEQMIDKETTDVILLNSASALNRPGHPEASGGYSIHVKAYYVEAPRPAAPRPCVLHV